MIEQYLNCIRSEVEDFIRTKRLDSAYQLAQETGHHFNWSDFPQYFVGRLDARLVMMHLNPKQKDIYDDHFQGNLPWSTFEEYYNYYSNFGLNKYGPNSGRTHKSPFDCKQVRFLKAFNVIDFVEESNKDDRYLNLERVIDHKLQFEIIPYGSDNFESNKMKNHIAPFLSTALDVIASHPRDYILFCGSVFDKIFSDSIVKTEKFRLKKNDGTWAKNEFRFSVLEFSHNGTDIKAGLAHSYAMQGIPMVEYGKKCADLYHELIG